MAANLVSTIREELQALGDPARGTLMQAYMKSSMPMCGVQKPSLVKLERDIFREFPLDTAKTWQLTCLKVWRGAKYREERYVAIDLTGYRRYRDFQTLETLPMYEEMIVTGAWWDFVDTIAKDRLGPLLKRYPAVMRKKLSAWARGDDMWKRRSAVLSQLGFKQETDLDFLHACIAPSLTSKKFFLQKAIGWALRQYAWTNPSAVERYVKQHTSALSPLSRREALKNIG